MPGRMCHLNEKLCLLLSLVFPKGHSYFQNQSVISIIGMFFSLQNMLQIKINVLQFEQIYAKMCPVHRNYYLLKVYHNKFWLILFSFWSIVFHCCGFGKPFHILHANCCFVFQRFVLNFFSVHACVYFGWLLLFNLSFLCFRGVTMKKHVLCVPHDTCCTNLFTMQFNLDR